MRGSGCGRGRKWEKQRGSKDVWLVARRIWAKIEVGGEREGEVRGTLY